MTKLRTVALITTVAFGVSACEKNNLLPTSFMPTAPNECAQVMDFHVPELPKGKTTDAQVAVWLAKDSVERQQEHAIAQVCAKHALKTAGALKEKEVPAKAQHGVVAAPASAVAQASGSRPGRRQKADTQETPSAAH
jgi:hypothetical protein